MDANISLGDIISWMVDSSRADFFARLLMGIPTQKLRLSGAAMALRLGKQGYIVYWDPEYLKEASLDHIIFVLYHEMHHFVLEHIPRQMRLAAIYQAMGERKLFDLVTPFAIDLAANQETAKHSSKIYKKIKDQSPPPIMPGVPPFEKLPLGKTYEWYVKYLADAARDEFNKQEKQLKNILDWLAQQRDILAGKSDDYLRGFADGARQSAKDRKEQSNGKGGQPHEKESQDYKKGFADGYNQEKKAPQGAESLVQILIHNRTLEGVGSDTGSLLERANELEHWGRRIIVQAVDDCIKSRGKIPRYLQSRIDDLLQKSRIPWTKILRNKVINTQRYKRRRSLGRPRRRHAGIPRLVKFPGYTKERKFRVAFCIDTSGSMGTEELRQGLGELQGLQKADKDIEIHVIECDAAVGRVYKIGPNDKIRRNVTGRGGTKFDPAVIKAKELNPDIVIYFTDGYAPPIKVENRVSCPFVWVITPRGKIPDRDFGFAITTNQ